MESKNRKIQIMNQNIVFSFDNILPINSTLRILTNFIQAICLVSKYANYQKLNG